MVDLIEKFDFLDNIWGVFKFLMGASVLIIGYFLTVHKMFKVGWKLAKNLDRSLFIFCPAGGKKTDGQPIDMTKELDVLRRAGFFKIPPGIKTDFNNIDEEEIKNCGIVLLGYHRSMSHFKDFIEMVKRNDRPLIVCTFELGLSLDKKDLKILRPYKWYSLASTPLRLVSDVFATLASFDYGQNKN